MGIFNYNIFCIYLLQNFVTFRKLIVTIITMSDSAQGMECGICAQDDTEVSLIKFSCCGRSGSSFSCCKGCAVRMVTNLNSGTNLKSTDPSDKSNLISSMNNGALKCPHCGEVTSVKNTFTDEPCSEIFFRANTTAGTCPKGKPCNGGIFTPLDSLFPSELTLTGNAQWEYISKKNTSPYTGIMASLDGIYVSTGTKVFDSTTREWKLVTSVAGVKIVPVTNLRVVSLTLSASSPQTLTLLGSNKEEMIFSLSENPPV